MLWVEIELFENVHVGLKQEKVFNLTHMHTSDDTSHWLIHIITSDIFQQIVPVLVLFLLPALVLLATTTLRPKRLVYCLSMGLESIGLSLSWIFHSGSKSGSLPGSTKSANHKKSKKHIRTRAEQAARAGTTHYGQCRLCAALRSHYNR